MRSAVLATPLSDGGHVVDCDRGGDWRPTNQAEVDGLPVWWQLMMDVAGVGDTGNHGPWPTRAAQRSEASARLGFRGGTPPNA